MKIPGEPAPRQAFVADVLNKCLASREERRTAYKTLKQFYMYGTDGAEDSTQIINRLYSHVDQAASFLYSQETTRFSIEIGKSVSDLELPKVPPLNDAVNDEWHASNTDIQYGEALNWSHVYGTMLIKSRWNVDHIESFVVEPINFGVYREDVLGLDRQEAFVHIYVIPKGQLRYELTTAQHTDVDGIINDAVLEPINSDDQATGPVDKIITSASSPNVVGEVQMNLGARIKYVPHVAEEMARMYELYVFDDEIQDYRVFTIAHPWIIVYDREIDRMFLPHEHPFTQVCPYPAYDYFWGVSAIERLVPLQMMRNRRWQQVQHLMELQANSPKWGAGFTGSVDEIMDAMDTPNGLALAENPGAKLESMTPELPADLFTEINYIDEQFNEVTGTTNVMSGRGESGVRSDSHAAQLLRVGSSRTKRRALIVEDSLEKLATLYLKILQRYSKKTYRAEPASGKESVEFLPAQFTSDFIVKVDGHSNSPIFVQDSSQMALMLFKAKAIDRASLLDLLPVPMRDLLKSKLKNKIEPQEAAAAKAQQQAEAAGKVTKMRGK